MNFLWLPVDNLQDETKIEFHVSSQDDHIEIEILVEVNIRESVCGNNH